MDLTGARAALRALSDAALAPPGADVGRVRLARSGGIARVLLDHERRRNAVTVQMMLDLDAAVGALQADPGAAVVVSGAGHAAFCAGGDLRAVRASLLDRPGAEAMAWVMQAALDGLAALPVPVFGAVEGFALGGGAEILTACDHVVVGAGATVGFVQAGLGVSTGWGGARRLATRVGTRRAALLLARARRMTSDEALQAGVVDEVVEAGGALARAMALAREVAANPPAAVQAAVRAARSGSGDAEREAFLGVWGGPAHRRALGLEGDAP